MDPENYWLVSGTNSGYLTGWDIRFFLPFREWNVHSENSPIYSLVPYTTGKLASKSSFLCASEPGDFSLWDLDSGKSKFHLC